MNIELSGHYTCSRLIRTALPSIAMVLITSLYSIVDGFFVSNFAGKSGFAAVNMMMPPIMILGSLGLMIGSGGAALVAKVKGEGDNAAADRIFSMLVWVALVVGATSGLIFALLAPTITSLLGADAGMFDECVRYSRLSMIGMPAFVLQMAFQSFYMAAERPQLGTIMSVVCGVANIALDALLVGAWHLGVDGAAVATVFAQFIGGFFPLIYFASRRNRGSLHIVRTSLDWHALGKACTNGLSEYVSSIAMSVVSICYNLQLMRLIGEDGVAAYGVLMYISFAFLAVFMGYNIAVTPVIGYNYGAHNIAELRSLLWRSVAIIGVSGVLLTAASELLSEPCARLFVGYSADLTALTCHAIRIYMLCFLVCGLNMFVSALFTGLQNGIISAVAAFARSLVFEMICVWLLPVFWGIDDIWMAVDMAELLTFVLCCFLVMRHAPQLVSRRGLLRQQTSSPLNEKPTTRKRQ